MNAILQHTVWPRIKPYLRATNRGKDSMRVEIGKAIPRELASEVLAATVPCVFCSADIHFVRNRRAANDRHPFSAPFITVSCDTATNASCCRSKAATDAIRALVADLPSEVVQHGI